MGVQFRCRWRVSHHVSPCRERVGGRLTLGRSSRLIIRNLAPTTTPASLREHLEAPEQLKGCVITDVKVVGKRRFAFVGYRSNEEAARVKDWWEGAYLGGSRVRVEEVRDEVSCVVASVRGARSEAKGEDRQGKRATSVQCRSVTAGERGTTEPLASVRGLATKPVFQVFLPDMVV